jgi:hypothetical protein
MLISNKYINKFFLNPLFLSEKLFILSTPFFFSFCLLYITIIIRQTKDKNEKYTRPIGTRKDKQADTNHSYDQDKKERHRYKIIGQNKQNTVRWIVNAKLVVQISDQVGFQRISIILSLS